MSGDDVTTKVLIDIRDEIRKTNDEVRKTNERLDQLRVEVTGEIKQTNQRIDRLSDRVTDMDLRTATAITEMVASNRDLHAMLADRFDLRDRLDRVERDVAELKAQR